MASSSRTITSERLRSRTRTDEKSSSGTEGNERLTSIAGALLFVLLAAEGVTVLSVKSLFTAHAFIGVMLIGPLSIKLGSTGYRFFRYYTGSEAYRWKGAPQPVLRILAPVLVASTLALFGTGIALLVMGPNAGHSLIGLHRASFIIWFGVAAVHVVYYMWRVPGVVVRDSSAVGRLRAPGAPLRLAIAGAGLALGVAAAVAFLPAMSTWSTWFHLFHHFRR